MDAAEPKLQTRCGYKPYEIRRALEKRLTQNGTLATGQILHYTADIVLSGGVDVFLQIIWDYALFHIGIASPRIFIYLKARVKDIRDILRRFPEEGAYALEEFQVRIGELILVVREAPTRTTLTWPKVGKETHNEGWLTAAAGATETAALRKVWRPEGDSPILRTAGAEICRAIADGSTQKALFWIQWLLEEEVRIRKETKGAQLTSFERGATKAAGRVGFFLVTLFGEIYKEYATKQVVRMHEEFQSLIDIYRQGESYVGPRSRRQILGVLAQILCEVPRWKVPAAPSLIKDPVAMTQAIKQVPRFFREVLVYDPPKNQLALVKAFKSKSVPDDVLITKAEKHDVTVEKMNALDKAVEQYFMNK